MWSPVIKCHWDIDMVVGFHYYKMAGDPYKKRCKGWWDRSQITMNWGLNEGEKVKRQSIGYSFKKLALNGIGKVWEGWRVGQERISSKDGRTWDPQSTGEVIRRKKSSSRKSFKDKGGYGQVYTLGAGGNAEGISTQGSRSCWRGEGWRIN